MPTPRKTRNQCRNCGHLVSRRPKVYCNSKCQMDYQYNQFIKQWIDRRIEGGRIGGVSSYIRRYLLETQGEQCSICNWQEKNTVTGKVPLEVDHIDGNYRHNSPENVRLICPNCHSLTPTFRGLNKGNGREMRRTRLLSTTVSTVVL